MSVESKIESIINSKVIIEIGKEKIIPRKDDLPNHYVKGSNLKEENNRKQVIANIEDNIKHDHSQCNTKIIAYKNDGKIVLDVGCKKARYILKKKSTQSHEFFLISGFKLREHQFKRTLNKTNTTEIKSDADFEFFLKCQ